MNERDYELILKINKSSIVFGTILNPLCAVVFFAVLCCVMWYKLFIFLRGVGWSDISYVLRAPRFEFGACICICVQKRGNILGEIDYWLQRNHLPSFSHKIASTCTIFYIGTCTVIFVSSYA